MAWFKIDDRFWSHPKVIGLPASAGWLWTRAGSYSSSHLTDGYIDREALRMLGGKERDAAELVKAGLWEIEGSDAWRFHDWTDQNPSRSEWIAGSGSRSERARRAANARWHRRPDQPGPDDA